MNLQIENAIRKGRLIIFLGAGASLGSRDRNGTELPDAATLAKDLSKEAGLAFAGEDLPTVYAAAKHILGARLKPFLEQRFRHCQPSPALKDLARYAWARVYTLNIDDCFEEALKHNSKQIHEVRHISDPIAERDVFMQMLDVVKLNGSVDRLKDGLIFSPAEYAKATTRSLSWYEELSFDFIRNTFLFVGTKLNEPLLKYHIEQYKSKSREVEGVSFVLTPSATEIEKLGMKEYNLEHISGGLSDFTRWLAEVFPTPLLPIDIAKNSLPPYAAALSSSDPKRFLHLLESVETVRRDLLLKSTVSYEKNESIRSFYKGFKPTWADILEGVPTELRTLKVLLSDISAAPPGSLVPLIGPAGSGKTTLLMQAALEISKDKDSQVYFLAEPIDKFVEMLEALARSAAGRPVFVFTDKLDSVAESVAIALKGGRLQNVTIVGSERVNIWNNRTSEKLLGTHRKPVEVRDIDESDAASLLEKIERFGNWTRLGQMARPKRLQEILDRSRKQLLIALLEATAGRGFEEIIESDYKQLGSEQHKAFFVLSALATVHRTTAGFRHLDRALKYLGIDESAERFAREMTGVVSVDGDSVQVRHPVYARYLLEKVVDPTKIALGIKANLHAFTAYQSPVIKHVSKAQAVFYKGILNHTFLMDVLKRKRELVLSVYSEFEKSFENDGLFWLHYGLCFRDFGSHIEALEKLNVARQAYVMDHTLHAYAQQLLIVGSLAKDQFRAYALLKEAKEILIKLDCSMDGEDTYPIVTLAEGHTSIVRTYEGEEAARDVAKAYANNLDAQLRKHTNHKRLRVCWEKLAKYVNGGSWSNESLEQWMGKLTV